MTPDEHMQEAYYDYCDNEERAGHIGAPFAVWKAAQLKARANAAWHAWVADMQTRPILRPIED